MTAFIHPKAHVEGAQIGADAKVFQFASVFGGAVIGERTVIGPCVMINGSRIGQDCKVSYGVNMGPGFIIGDEVFLGPEVVLCNDRWPRCHKTGFDVTEFDGSKWAVIIEHGASLGVRATVLPGVRIGRRAMVAAHTVVACDVPDDHLLMPDGTLTEITDEDRKVANRMRFARPVLRPWGSDHIDRTREMLDVEQRRFLQAAGMRDDELDSFQ